MLYLTPPGKDVAFHFSVEAYFTEQFHLNEPLFMIWQAQRCAMLGSYQVARAELNLPYVAAENVQIVRRQSGGGTIFTDEGTLLCSLIVPQPKDVGAHLRNNFAAPIVQALNALGIPAEMQGRNDILVEGKKVCGMAQHVRNGRICTHGSLLYDTDLDMLASVLRVDAAKIQSKAIASVRSRVTNLKPYMATPVPISQFWALLEEALLKQWPLRPYTLTESDLAAVDEIYRTRFNEPNWTWGRTPQFSYQNAMRFPAGKLEISLNIDQGIVMQAELYGDFLGTVPVQGLEDILKNIPFQYEAIAKVLADIDLAPYLGEISGEAFLSCLFGNSA